MKWSILILVVLSISLHAECSFLSSLWGSGSSSNNAEVNTIGDPEINPAKTPSNEAANELSPLNPSSVQEAPSSGGWGFGSFGNKLNSITNSVTNTVSHGVSGVASGIKGVANGALNVATGAAGAAVDLWLLVTEKAINTGIDFFLFQYKLFVRTMRLDEMPLPTISLSPPFINSFEAKNGFFKSLSSLSKDGDFTLRRNGTSLTIDVPMKLEDLEIGYRNYSLDIKAGLGMSGMMTIGVKTNRIHLRFKLSMSTTCAVDIEELDFADMEGIEVKFTGICGLCGVAASKMGTYMAEFVQSSVKKMVLLSLRGVMNMVLSENSSLCTKFLT